MNGYGYVKYRNNFARNSLSTFVYVHHMYLPIVLAPVIFIVALSLKNAASNYLQPLWGNVMVRKFFIDKITNGWFNYYAITS